MFGEAAVSHPNAAPRSSGPLGLTACTKPQIKRVLEDSWASWDFGIPHSCLKTRRGGWKCVCYPEEQGPVSFRALEGQHTIAQGEQESVELEPMEKAKELDRQNRIIHSGIGAEHGGDRTALKTLP